MKALIGKHKKTILSAAAAFLIISLSVVYFMYRIDLLVRENVQNEIQAVIDNRSEYIQSEISHLTNITETAGYFMSRITYADDSDIIDVLQNYTKHSNVVRSLFITADGKAYTNYAGYLGKSDKNKKLGNINLSEIKYSILSDAVYDSSLNKIVFGVLSPVTLGDQTGILISSYDMDQLLPLLHSNLLNGQSVISIYRKDGEILLQNKELPVNETVYSSSSSLNIKDWNIKVSIPESIIATKSLAYERAGIRLGIVLIATLTISLSVVLFIRMKEVKKVHSSLARAARIDGLTGICNRSTAEIEISHYLKNSAEHAKHALFIMDIDNFKKVNDQFGHMTGDLLLQKLASLLVSAFDDSDIVGRIGGDEFTVLFSNYGTIDKVKEKAQNIVHAFSSLNIVAFENLNVSLSVGISVFGIHGTTFEELYQKADEALYHTKQKGKNGYAIIPLPEEN